jgi:hypothetical protein
MLGRTTSIVARRSADRPGAGSTTSRSCARASTPVGAVSVLATPANHDGWRPPFGPRAGCLGFIVEGTERVYFAGDTDLFPEMSALGPIDLALLPVWGWGPTLGPGHLIDERPRALTLIRLAMAAGSLGSFFPAVAGAGSGRLVPGYATAGVRGVARDRARRTCAWCSGEPHLHHPRWWTDAPGPSGLV